MAFLGLCNYSCQYVPEFNEKTELVRGLITTQGCRNLHANLAWSDQDEAAFTALKQDLLSATTLQAPDYTAPFHLDVTHKRHYVNAVLWQPKRGVRRILHYHSSTLDVPDQGLPECAKHITAVAQALAKTSHLTLNHPTVVHTTHGVKEAIESDSFVVCNANRKQRMAEALTSTAPRLRHDDHHACGQRRPAPPVHPHHPTYPKDTPRPLSGTTRGEG